MAKMVTTIKSSKRYLLGSSDFHEEPEDQAPIAYTEELAGLVGRRVLVRCCVDEFHEERATTRGKPYHVEVQYLDCPKVMAVGGDELEEADDDEIAKFNELVEACYQ
jgi:hypothetical protein